MSNQLSTTERRTLDACEADIEKGKHFIVNAFTKIRDERLYRATHGTFEDYCQERWELSRRHVNRLIAHEKVVAILAEDPEMGPIGPKLSEAATREIADLPPETQVEVVKKATQNGTVRKPSAKAVAQVREEVAPKAPTPQQQVRDFFAGGDGEAVEVVEAPAPKKPAKGTPKDFAALADNLTRSYISPLVRGIDELAKQIGGRGKYHAQANDGLNSVIDAVKNMRKGEQ